MTQKLAQKVQKEQIIGLKELRLDTEKYIKKIAKGESFVVVKRSKPVFIISKVKEKWETILDVSDEGGIPLKDLQSHLAA